MTNDLTKEKIDLLKDVKSKLKEKDETI